MNKQQALIKEKRKGKKDESTTIKRSRRQRGKKISCQVKCVLIVKGVFSILITHMSKCGDRECYITHSPLVLLLQSLCFFDISLLNYIFKSIFAVKRFMGQAYTMTTCYYHTKNNNNRKRKKK